MEEYIEEYKKILFFIDEYQNEIDGLKHDINVYENRKKFLDNEIADRFGSLEEDIKLLEDKKKKVESNIVLRDVFKNKFKINLISTVFSLLITSCLFFFNLLDVNILMKFLLAISTSLTILLSLNSMIVLINFIKLKRDFNISDLSNLNMRIDSKKRALKRIYTNNGNLLIKKKKLEKLIEDNYKKIRDNRRKISYLNKEKNKFSNLLLESIHEDVINSYKGEIEGQLMIPGVKTLVRRNVDNM